MDEYGVSLDLRPQAETYGQEIFLLRSSKAEIILSEAETVFLVDIDAKEEAYETLIGCQFLERFISILDGPEKQNELRWDF